MADKVYDAVIIGSGHNGLIAGCYLQEAGLNTCILEAYHEVGGGVSGTEVPLPGFLANDCAADIRINQIPVYQDLELYDYGYKVVFPDAPIGTVFDDGTAVVLWSPFVVKDEKASKLEMSRVNVEKSMKEIAKFSKRDADTYYHLIECWDKKWRDAYFQWRFNPPVPWGQLDPLEALVGDKECPVDQRFFNMSTWDTARELWESDEMRLHYMAYGVSWGSFPEKMLSFPLMLRTLYEAFSLVPPEIPKGGTHTFAHALQRHFSYHGGEFLVEAEVEKVLIENGLAKGVRLVDGTEIGARKLVISNVDLIQTLINFIGEDYFDSNLVRKIRNVYYKFGQAEADVLWGHFAVHELPKYNAKNFNSDCEGMVRTQVVPKDVKWFCKRWNQIMEYKSGDSIAGNRWLYHNDSLWDRRAPAGKHNLMIEQLGIRSSEASERGWRQLKMEFPDALLKEWQKYAPNMTRDNLIGAHFYGARDVAKKNKIMINGWPGMSDSLSARYRNRPIPELSQYRTPIKNYYLASLNCHEGACVVCSPGYNCYKEIAKDLGLRKPWEEKGRQY